MMGFCLFFWFLFLFTSLIYVRAGGKSSQSSQVQSHIWFSSMIMVAGWVCRSSGGRGSVLTLFVISFGRQYVCIVSVQVAKQDSIGLATEKSSLELRLAFRDRRVLCGSETWGKFSKRKGCPGYLKADQVACFSRKDSAGRVGTTYCPAWTSVQGMFKVTVYCKNIVFMLLLLVTSL